MADLNRGTFYLHYRDVFDLLEKTENELLDEFNSLMYRHNAQDLTNNLAAVFVDNSFWISISISLPSNLTFSFFSSVFINF